MLILVLGKGKTGSLVAEVARERGHSVRALDITENEHASALTAPTLAGVDVVIDFTAPEAAVENMRAVLALGARIVVGTTGWYAHVEEMKSLAPSAAAGCSMAPTSRWACRSSSASPQSWPIEGYTFSIAKPTTSKLDAPSGTAITLKEIIQAALPNAVVEITSHRIADAKGEHIVTATGPDDCLS